jgi:predicted enzyme related to lactoylglutathione lyase
MRNPIRLSRALAVAALIGSATTFAPRGEAAGEIYWFSLLTEDATAASAFYSELFSWQIEPSPTGALMAVRNGTPIAGISQIEDRIPTTSESMWLAAITVRDVAEALATAKQLGATVHEEVTELPGWGTFALIQDPQGAPLSLVVPERPLGGTQGYSGWRWAELWTHDVDGAANFYTKVIGYEREEVTVGEQRYTVFRSDGKRNAGLVALDQPQIAPRWAPYVGVSDLRGILVRVWQLRGKVLREPSEIDFEAAGKNRVALITDPTGAAMFLYQLDEQATADPGVAARTTSGSISSAQRAASTDRTGPNVSVSVSYGYGFGPGWGGAYPSMTYRAMGPIN